MIVRNLRNITEVATTRRPRTRWTKPPCSEDSHVARLSFCASHLKGIQHASEFLKILLLTCIMWINIFSTERPCPALRTGDQDEPSPPVRPSSCSGINQVMEAAKSSSFPVKRTINNQTKILPVEPSGCC